MQNVSIKRSASWAFVESLAPQIISFGITIVLSRLLKPADYGLIGMLALFLAFAQVFSDLGMSQALIQRKNISKNDETTVLYLNVIIGFIVMVILILASPLVALFFKEPRLRSILSVLAVGYFISSFGIVQNALFNRNLYFKKITIVTIVNTTVTGVTGIILAFLGFGVWSLIYASLAGITARVIAFWILSDWRPKGYWSRESLKSIWKFSGNILGAGLLTAFVDNLSNILIGKTHSASSLGFYTRAYQLQLLPVSLVTGVLNKVAFPVFSINQDNKEFLLNHLRKFINILIFIIAYICALLFLTAKSLIPFLFGKQWVTSIHYLEILAFAGIFYPINVLLVTLIKSTGRSDLFLKVEIINKIIMMTVLFTASFFSIEAMAFGLILTGFTEYIFNSSFAIPLVGYNWKMQFRDILPSVILFLLATIITSFISEIYNNLEYFWQLINTIIIFTVIIFPIFFLYRNKYFYDVWSLLKDTLINFKK